MSGKAAEITEKPGEQQLIPVEQVQEMIDKAAGMAADKIIAVFNDGKPKRLAEVAEKMMDEKGATDEDKSDLRDTLEGIPAEAQCVFLATYLDLKSSLLDKWDDTAKKITAHTAWIELKQQFRQAGGWRLIKTANVEQEGESWVVYHRNLKKPAVFANKTQAIDFAIGVSADEMTKVEWNKEKKVYEVANPGDENPVEASAAEVQEAVEKKLQDLGHDESSAKEHGEALVNKARVEENNDMSGTAKQAASSQVTPGKPSTPLVKGVGVPTDKIKQPKEGHPEIPGYVSTEPPAVAAVPSVKPGKDSMKQQHASPYESLARESDSGIDKLNRKRGLMTEVAKLASTDEGAELLSRFIAAAMVSRKAAEMGEEGRRALATKFKKGEKGFDMSACIQSLKNEKGIDNPEALCQHLKQEYVV